MITWNYCVFREANGDYIIREVFYGEDGSILGLYKVACNLYRFRSRLPLLRSRN